MPISALPPKMRDINFWDGTDNASWLMKLKKCIQYLLAAGPRVPSGFFKWRDIPITLLVLCGKGSLRAESSEGKYIQEYEAEIDWLTTYPVEINLETTASNSICQYIEGYLSRIQPWCRWHINLQWPLFFNCHFIYRVKDVVKYPKYQSDFGIKKMLTFGIGFKRDADKVYWLTFNGFGNFE